MTAIWILLFGVVLGVGFAALCCLLALVPTKRRPSPFEFIGRKRFSLTARRADAPGKNGTGSAHTEARGVTPEAEVSREGAKGAK